VPIPARPVRLRLGQPPCAGPGPGGAADGLRGAAGRGDAGRPRDFGGRAGGGAGSLAPPVHAGPGGTGQPGRPGRTGRAQFIGLPPVHLRGQHGARPAEQGGDRRDPVAGGVCRRAPRCPREPRHLAHRRPAARDARRVHLGQAARQAGGRTV
ncbi:MAG: hypothetical protein AVDCRST_MAG51-2714, partial [uncultured Ramlibacter sp.]